jgi:uncharacterized membrane protein (Fun14 family)
MTQSNRKIRMMDLTLADAFAPILFQIAIGGIGGFLIGYVLKRVFKVALLLAAIVFSLMLLAYTNIIDVDFGGLSDMASNFVTAIDPALTFIAPLLANVPFIASLIIGFILGITRD